MVSVVEGEAICKGLCPVKVVESGVSVTVTVGEPWAETITVVVKKSVLLRLVSLGERTSQTPTSLVF